MEIQNGHHQTSVPENTISGPLDLAILKMVPQVSFLKILTVAKAFGVCFLCGTAGARQINLEGSAMTKEICSVDGCEKKSKTGGLCSCHAERLRLKGFIGPAGPLVVKNLKCGVAGCKKSANGKYCSMHRTRYYALGNLGPVGEKVRPPIERILNKIKKRKSGCWEWPGPFVGYKRDRAQVSENGRMEYVSRIVYRHFKGEIPLKMCICHTCDNGKCANPGHLFLGTVKDNMDDCEKKGRRVFFGIKQKNWTGSIWYKKRK